MLLYFFSCVTSHMFSQISFLNERVAANWTNGFSLGVAPVDLDVVIPGRSVPEHSATLVAAVRLFAGVQPHVAFELVLAWKERKSSSDVNLSFSSKRLFETTDRQGFAPTISILWWWKNNIF